MNDNFYNHFKFPSKLCQQLQLLVPTPSWKLLAMKGSSSAKVALAIWFILGESGICGGEAEMLREGKEAEALCQVASDTTETFSTSGRFAVRRSFTDSFPCLSHAGCKVNCLCSNTVGVGPETSVWEERRRNSKMIIFYCSFPNQWTIAFPQQH